MINQAGNEESLIAGWLKPKSAARYCDIGERTLRTWLKEDGLRHVRIRGSILIKQQWMDAFLESFEIKDNDGDKVDAIVDNVMKEFTN